MFFLEDPAVSVFVCGLLALWFLGFGLIARRGRRILFTLAVLLAVAAVISLGFEISR